jgi:hypothetical protein
MDPTRTLFAQQALTLADSFQMCFTEPLGPYRAELAAPDGPSTGAGKQALQPIKLVPIEGGATLVVGHANPVQKMVDLRPYETLVRQHMVRFKKMNLELDRAHYDQFTQKLTTFFGNLGMQVTVSAPEPEIASDAPAGNRNWVLYGGIGALLLAALGGFALFGMRGH